MSEKPNFKKAGKIAWINQQFHEQTFPVLNAVRDEEQHRLELINGIIDKALDLGKLLIGISFPALITLYSLKRDEFNAKSYMILTFALLFAGILIFGCSMRYKYKNLSTYVESSETRLKSYTEMLETARLNAQNEDNKLEYDEIIKKS